MWSPSQQYWAQGGNTAWTPVYLGPACTHKSIHSFTPQVNLAKPIVACFWKMGGNWINADWHKNMRNLSQRSLGLNQGPWGNSWGKTSNLKPFYKMAQFCYIFVVIIAILCEPGVKHIKLSCRPPALDDMEDMSRKFDEGKKLWDKNAHNKWQVYSLNKPCVTNKAAWTGNEIKRKTCSNMLMFPIKEYELVQNLKEINRVGLVQTLWICLKPSLYY